MRALVLLALLTLLACSSGEQTAPSTRRAQLAREAFAQAIARGDRGVALAALEDLRRALPDTPDAALEYATLLVRAGEAGQTVWLLEEAVARSPEHEALALALGRATLLTADATRTLTAVSRIGPDSERYPEALVLRGQAQLLLGELDAALGLFQEAEGLQPELVSVRVPRIRALLQERRLDEAQQALRDARAASSGDAPLLGQLEAALFQLRAKEGEVELAVEGLRARIEAQPQDWSAWRALVDVLWRAGRASEARDLVAEALDANPEATPLLGTLASLQAALGESDVAEATLAMLFERTKSPAAALALAQTHLARDDVDAALAVYDESLDAFPRAGELRQARIETLIDADRLPEARREIAQLGSEGVPPAFVGFLEARLQLAEGDAAGAATRLRELVTAIDAAGTQYWLGRALELQGDLAGAQRRFAIAWKRGPQELAPLYGLLRVAEKRGDMAGIISASQQLVRAAPGQPEGWRALIAALLQLGEIDAAGEVSGSYVAFAPDRPGPHALRALVLVQRGQTAEALASWERARERGGDEAELAAQRALIEARRDPAAGIAAARSAVAAHPDSALAHATLAGLLFSAGQAEAGAAATERALALDPEDLRPLRARAEFHAATGDFRAALRDTDTYLGKRSQDAHVHFVRAAALDGLGETDAAIAAYRRAAELDERAFAPRNNLAELLAAQGDLDGALVAAQEAYALAGDNPYVMDTLGVLYLKKGLVDRSVAILEAAHRAAPELAEAQLHLAWAYREAGRGDEARGLLIALRDRGGRPDLDPEVEAGLGSL
jgi:tetratricopeptide (TPR) repeat protein